MEMFIKMVGLGYIFNFRLFKGKNSYFKDSWNILEFIIVGTSLI